MERGAVAESQAASITTALSKNETRIIS